MTNYQIIDSWETINGANVPINTDGHYLDWTNIDLGKKKAKVLTDPYGQFKYVIGNFEATLNFFYPLIMPRLPKPSDWFICFDWAYLPNGRMILHSMCNTDNGLIDLDYHTVNEKDAAFMASEMVCETIASMHLHGENHDKETLKQDLYYFVRSVAGHVGISPYDKMVQNCDENNLRFGSIPNIPILI